MIRHMESQATQRDGAAAERLAVALDFPSAREALDCVDRLEGCCRWMKVGMELYYAAGNGLIEELQSRDLRVFLDLKLHDIPHTVAGAVRSLASLGVDLLTIHALGGEAMLRAAVRAAAETAGAPRLLAVTVLTSMDRGEMAGVGLLDEPGGQVLRLGRLGEACGVDGLVCSAQETRMLRASLKESTMLVVPGIRPAGAEVGDQRRVATPAEAIAQGASLLVVGRPITQAADPGAAARAILDEIASAVS